MSETEYWKKLSTEALLKGYTSPLTTVFVGLGTSSFSVGLDSTVIGEVTSSGYQRQPIQWSDFVDEMTNSNTILWGVTSAWPAVSRAFISDSSQGGKALLYGTFASKTFTSGDVAAIDIGNLRLT
jgi:hypothetical protein